MSTTILSEWSGKPTTDQWRCENTNRRFHISRDEMENLKREMKKKENGERITRCNPKGEVVLSFDNPIVPKTKNQMKDPNKYICIICLDKTSKKCAIEKHLHVKNLQEEEAKRAKRKKIEKMANTKQRKQSGKKSNVKSVKVVSKNIVAKVAKKSCLKSATRQKQVSLPRPNLLSVPIVYPSPKKNPTVKPQTNDGWKVLNGWTTVSSAKQCIPVAKPEDCTNVCCFLIGNNKCIGRGVARRHSTKQQKITRLWFSKPNLQAMSGGLWALKKILWVQDNLKSKPKKSKDFDQYLKIFSNTALELAKTLNSYETPDRPPFDFAMYCNAAVKQFLKQTNDDKNRKNREELITEHLQPTVLHFTKIFESYKVRNGVLAPFGRMVFNEPKQNLPIKVKMDVGKDVQKDVTRTLPESIVTNFFRENQDDEQILHLTSPQSWATPLSTSTISSLSSTISPEFDLKSPSFSITPPGFKEKDLLENQISTLESEKDALRCQILECERASKDNKKMLSTLIGKISMLSDSDNYDASIMMEFVDLMTRL